LYIGQYKLDDMVRLLKYGYRDIAQQARNSRTGCELGFREYYNPFTGEGPGRKSFAWTAALVIDLIKNKPTGIPQPDTCYRSN